LVKPGLEEWATQRERGSVTLIRLMAWITLRLGRPTARLLLGPACVYFFVFASRARKASRGWLSRVLGRPARLSEIWRHFWYFGACVLDRVLLLNDRADLFEINLHGVDLVTGIRDRHPGGFLFGAHLGSFEVVRAIGRALGDTRISLVMYEDNARKTNQVLNAINPALAMDIIGLGQPGSMLAVKRRLDDGYLIGILPDRVLNSERHMMLPFFGVPARFPVGPFRLAVILRQPVLFMVGLYRGGRRYDIRFELIAEPEATTPLTVERTIEAIMRRYVALLEEYCRSEPYNWFNFFEFWDPAGDR
jgi:predicted LPLAT superfamily acyltransferase